ncbi:thioesterase II family protein [Streptomyces sp. NPDC052043]|uniref:thioesterase II family protein n=1 Tax=Streptomyces sp. NPDC052043 TaxID=3365684 RepID=UPI0037D10BA1
MTSAALDHDAWIRTFDAGPKSGPMVDGFRLVCFPHAGGSASFYFPYSKLLRPEIEVLAVQYPGRQDRRGEPCLDEIGALADRAAEVLRGHRPNERLAFFGHSMGAAVAFETARRLEEGPGPRVLHLFASARRAPSAFRPEFVHRKDDDGLVAELQALSGTDPVLLADPEVRALLLPTIRSDYRAIESYRCEQDASVACPVTVLIGDADPRVSVTDARLWEGHTSRGFEVRVLPGGHFYLEEQRDVVVAGIRAALHEHL